MGENTKTLIASALVLIAALLFGGAVLGCGDTLDLPPDDAHIGETGVLRGHTSQAAIDDSALSLDQIVARGQHLFTASFNTLDGAGRPETTDVGANNFRRPRMFPENFNRISGPDANSCSSCHNLPRTGGGADNSANVFVLADRLQFVNFDRQDGDGLESHTLKTVGNERTSLGLFGSGYVELLAREMTSDLHAIRDQARRESRQSGADIVRDLSTKGVDFGRITVRPDGTIDTDQIEGVADDLIIRPFMQKGTIVSLREFAVKATNQHFGMQASERFGDAIDHDADGLTDELSRGDITALVVFQAALPAPVRQSSTNPESRAAAERGEAMFATVGCVSCHIPELPLTDPTFSEPNPFNPSGKLQVADVDTPFEVDLTAIGGGPTLRRDQAGNLMVPVFTDLKRHKMGDILDNEILEEEGIPTDEWLTRKLWGFASEPPFLHHGRATLMSEAILAHGGDARASRDSFAALEKDDQADLIEFLKTLQIPPDAAQPGVRSSGPGGFGPTVIWAAVGGGVAGALLMLAVLVFARGFRRSTGDTP